MRQLNMSAPHDTDLRAISRSGCGGVELGNKPASIQAKLELQLIKGPERFFL